MSYRLLKVICQPVLVETDLHGNLVEHLCNPIAVPGHELGAFVDSLADQIAQLTNGSEP